MDPITQVSTFIQLYGTGTGFAYGGAASASDDYAALRGMGYNSGSSKNNADGLSGGLWVDMSAAASTTNQFDQANFASLVKIYGDNNTDGLDLTSAFTTVKEAMVISTDQSEGGDGDGAYLPSAPEDGVIGIAGDGDLGDNAKLRLRIYLPALYTAGGFHQVEWVVAYSYTA